MINKLIKFAKANYEIFGEMPESVLQRLFETYKDTTIVYQVGGEIKGFAIYQEWPDCLNFIAICGTGSKIENLAAMLKVCEQLPAKKICYFDEENMELKIICPRQQQ